MQDVLLAIWRAAPHFDRTRGAETTLIATVGRRCLIDRRRKAAVRPDPISLNQEPTDEIAKATTQGCLSSALARLKPEQKDLLELAIVHGKTPTQIARSTGLPLGTVKSAIHRVLARLREELATRHAAA